MKSHGIHQIIWRRYGKRWAFKLALIVLAMFWLAMMATAWTEDANAADEGPSRSPAAASDGNDSSSDEYNFNWLDPEKKIYVLQNRRYEKAQRALISLMGGIGFSNPYRSTYNIDGRLAFYFSEAWGIEGFYTGTKNSENNVYKALLATGSGATGIVREIHSQVGGLVHWVPWYAKINVFNTILYFDWYFGAGLGSLDTSATNYSQPSGPLVPQSLFSYFLSTGHQYHITHDLTFRIDVTGAYFRAPLLGTAGEDTWYSNYNFGIGLGLRL